MPTYKTVVDKIEKKENEKGVEYLEVTIAKGKGQFKVKKIYEWGQQEALAGGPGVYNFEYEEQPNGAFFITGIAPYGENAQAKTPPKAPEAAKDAPQAAKPAQAAQDTSNALNRNYGANGNKDRQIAAAVLIKATVETMGPMSAPTLGSFDVAGYFQLSSKVFNHWARMLEEYVARPEKEAQDVKALSTVPDEWSKL